MREGCTSCIWLLIQRGSAEHLGSSLMFNCSVFHGSVRKKALGGPACPGGDIHNLPAVCTDQGQGLTCEVLGQNNALNRLPWVADASDGSTVGQVLQYSSIGTSGIELATLWAKGTISTKAWIRDHALRLTKLAEEAKQARQSRQTAGSV